MGVGIDAAGHYQLIAGIDDLAAFRNIEIVANGVDFSIDAKHVGAVGISVGDDGAALDQ